MRACAFLVASRFAGRARRAAHNRARCRFVRARAFCGGGVARGRAADRLRASCRVLARSRAEREFDLLENFVEAAAAILLAPFRRAPRASLAPSPVFYPPSIRSGSRFFAAPAIAARAVIARTANRARTNAITRARRRENRFDQNKTTRGENDNGARGKSSCEKPLFVSLRRMRASVICGICGGGAGRSKRRRWRGAAIRIRSWRRSAAKASKARRDLASIAFARR